VVADPPAPYHGHMAPTETSTPVDPDATATPPGGPATSADDDLVEEELLVEEISIDGMCGVY